MNYVSNTNNQRAWYILKRSKAAIHEHCVTSCAAEKNARRSKVHAALFSAIMCAVVMLSFEWHLMALCGSLDLIEDWEIIDSRSDCLSALKQDIKPEISFNCSRSVFRVAAIHWCVKEFMNDWRLCKAPWALLIAQCTLAPLTNSAQLSTLVAFQVWATQVIHPLIIAFSTITVDTVVKHFLLSVCLLATTTKFTSIKPIRISCWGRLALEQKRSLVRKSLLW